MIPPPTFSRTAWPRETPAEKAGPARRKAEDYDHPYLRTLAGIGCGLVLLPIGFLYLVGVISFGVPAAIILLPLLLAFLVPVVFIFWWANPGHFAVSYTMVWTVFTALVLLVPGLGLWAPP